MKNLDAELDSVMIHWLLAFLLAMLPTPAIAADCVHDANAFRCVHFVRAHDGDTLTVDIPGLPPVVGKQVPVRIRGIDTAEMTGHRRCEKAMATRAATWLQQALSKADRIDLEQLGRDKYFRLLANVVIDGRSIGPEMIAQGLAVAYNGGTKPVTNWCSLKKSREGK